MIKKELEQALYFHNNNELDKAEEIYKKLIETDSKDYNSFFLLGTILAQKKKFAESIKFFITSLEINQNNYIAHNNLGLSYYNLGNTVSALVHFKKSLVLNSTYAGTHNNVGLIYLKEEKYNDAINCFKEAIRLQPNFAEVFNNIGIANRHLHNFSESRLNFEKATNIKPNYYEAYNNIGVLFANYKKYREAIKYFSEAIKINPEYAEGYFNRGEAYFQINDYIMAVRDLEISKKIDPRKDNGTLFFTKLKIGEWNTIEEQRELLKKQIIETNFYVKPFISLSLTDSTSIQKRNFENFILKKKISQEVYTTMTEHKKIRIGYISSDFYNHATSHLICNLLETHDKNNFEIYTFNLSTKIDDFTKRISNATNLVDISSMSLDRIKNTIENYKIDIAVDLKGHTQNSRPDIFYKRVAPIQINYLGHPGTIGHRNIDYIIADHFLINKEQEKNYIEKIIFLPNCYQPSNSIPALDKKKFSKEYFGLPEDNFIFCCFNNSYKITPNIFNVWLRILKRVSKSVIWILEDNLLFKENLKKKFKENNLNPDRIIFCKRTSLNDHLVRFHFADLFLDTFPYCAHTTANEALQSSLPLLTISGESFASRVSGSLLSSTGILELITYNEKDYEQTAIRLAEKKSELIKIKNKLNLNKNILSNIHLYASNLERAYSEIYSLCLKGKQTKNIDIN
jgi:predicted O-linked N-acetylglucosamine transferase (SPINDLY family)